MFLQLALLMRLLHPKLAEGTYMIFFLSSVVICTFAIRSPGRAERCAAQIKLDQFEGWTVGAVRGGTPGTRQTLMSDARLLSVRCTGRGPLMLQRIRTADYARDKDELPDAARGGGRFPSDDPSRSHHNRASLRARRNHVNACDLDGIRGLTDDLFWKSSLVDKFILGPCSQTYPLPANMRWYGRVARVPHDQQKGGPRWPLKPSASPFPARQARQAGRSISRRLDGRTGEDLSR